MTNNHHLFSHILSPITLHRIASHHQSYHTTSHSIISNHITSPILPHHITSHYITSLTLSNHITSHHLTNPTVGVASDVAKATEGCFYFSMIWSVGACVDGEGRRKFDLFFRAALAGAIEESPEFQDFRIKNPEYEGDPRREAKVSVPEGDDVYAYFFDSKQGRWIHWLEGRPTFKIANDAKFNAIMVPTIDTIRNEWLVEKLLVKGYHVMATGDTGTGKSLPPSPPPPHPSPPPPLPPLLILHPPPPYPFPPAHHPLTPPSHTHPYSHPVIPGKSLSIKNKLLSGMPAKFNSININFSAQTTANQTQDLIDSKLDKRRKGVLGPPLGMITVVFLGEHSITPFSNLDLTTLKNAPPYICCTQTHFLTHPLTSAL